MVEARTDTARATPQADREGSSRVRTCVGCGERVEVPRSGAAPSVLVRLVLGPGGEVAVDAAGGGFGRGAHVHPRPSCVEKAAQRGLSRAAKGKVSLLWDEAPEQPGEEAASETAPSGKLVPLDASSLSRAIVRGLDRRVQGLVVAAARARKVALGADAVTGADVRDEAELIVVATDAAAGSELSAVRRAVSEGRAVAWGTKKVLATLCSAAASSKRAEGLAVVAIKDDRIAAALREAVQAASALAASPVEGAAAGRKRHDARRPGGTGQESRSTPKDAGGGIEGDGARSGQDRRADG
ncbi:YlxR family protein [Polyangium sp. 6x1]|uniref:YlxR family protein n=1 Tax=Polyangium sp. 6x1 TaxID=3042689 RepID=UPI002482A140|nr:YlxR family protein [Polyangium sp. 6x1]MDI1443951.1 YlxR family protein [Polyangium sp. 6x1]